MAGKLVRAMTAATATVALASGAGSALAATVPEAESNNAAATANALDTANQCYARGAGALDPAGDLDFWSFGVTAGTSVWTETDTGGTQVGTPTSRDTLLDLIDVDGTTALESDDDDGTGNGGDGTIETGNASIVAGATFPQAGTGFVRVSAISPAATIDPYRLFVATTTKAPVAEQEPNDALGTANPVPGCDTPIAGAMDVAADVDQFSFQLAAGETVFVALDADPDRLGATALRMRLAGPDGSDVLGPVNSSGSARGTAEGFDFDATASGLYTVRVVADDPTRTGDYRLLVATPDRTPPTALIAGGPSGPTSDARPAFAFGGNDDKTTPSALRFQCAIAPQGQAPAFADCAPPTFQPAAPLPGGAYAFAVRAIDATGNVGAAATRSFSVARRDTVKPVVRRLAVRIRTVVVRGRRGRRASRVRLVTVTFRASDAAPGRVAKLACKLDRGRYRRCTTRTTFRGVKNGRHTVAVRVTDAAGNVTTASKRFTVGPRRRRRRA